jgi:integrase
MYKKELSDNTIASRVAKLKTFLRWAQENNYHDNEAYKKFKYLEREVDSVSLTWEELQKLKNYQGARHESEVRDLFLIGCLSGQRYSDYSVFNKSDLLNGFIEKRAKKTFEKSYIPINKNALPYLLKLMERYEWNLPLIDATDFNVTIREVCRKCKITNDFKKQRKSGKKVIELIEPKYKFISSHTARRTFITISLNKGINPMIVMKQTGITKLETLKTYYQFDKEQMTQQIGRVWKLF